MKKAFSFAAIILMLAGVIITPVNTYAYEYTGGTKKAEDVTISWDPSGAWEEDKEFTNDSVSFTVNAPAFDAKYTVGQEIPLSVTPQRFSYTVMGGGFRSALANNFIMTILKGDSVLKTFEVDYYADDTGKTFTDSFIPKEEGTYKINIFYRGATYSGSNYGNYFIQVAKAEKKTNPVSVKISSKTVKYKKLKKKAVTVQALTVKKAEGTVSYKKLSGSKKITVNKKTGKITIKKGTKKGTYKVKIRIKAAGNDGYKSKTISKTVKIKVK